jgi:ubiquinone/menaquinone biosynthesis C-methylase UbiE
VRRRLLLARGRVVTRGETERVRRIQDKQAPGYDRSMDFFERLLWACAQLEGDVLEIAIGTGRNVGLYPPGLRVTGVELSPEMLARAQARADDLGAALDLRLGDAQNLELADASFDTVLITFALCTIPDDRAAVAEAFRAASRRPAGGGRARAKPDQSCASRSAAARAGVGSLRRRPPHPRATRLPSWRRL